MLLEVITFAYLSFETLRFAVELRIADNFVHGFYPTIKTVREKVERESFLQDTKDAFHHPWGVRNLSCILSKHHSLPNRCVSEPQTS